MQIIQSMPFSSDGIITSAVSVALGWLAGSFTKVSRTEFKELLTRVGALEKDLTGRMTRTEFEQAFSKIEQMVRDFRVEAKAEFKDLKSELKTKT